ncbi:nitroreductase [Bosea sp. AS-1]|uniref:nitroreductase family protein n=1 Tax=Bosea sp. AS-1 TaxID=2015316 RepID=UPI000B7910C1|nr:nitroreductase [Bosea sp. AS-1]
MEFFEALYGRRATRAFSPQPVSGPVIERLIDAAIQAPSAINEQPWDFAIIQESDLLDRIAGAAKELVSNIAEHAPPRPIHANLQDPNFNILYHAPALIVISARTGEWAVEDGTLAAENLMLAAHALGLGSCWIGLAQRWLETEDGRRAIEIPAGFMPIAPIIIGYPSEKAAPVPRTPARTRWIGNKIEL